MALTTFKTFSNLAKGIASYLDYNFNIIVGAFGVANGFATLDSDGKVPLSQIPSTSTTTADKVTDGTNLIRTKIVSASWNMDTTAFINIAHGVVPAKIRGISACINSGSVAGADFAYDNGAGTGNKGISFNSINITLERKTGGVFDSSVWNSATAFAVITYVD